MPTIAMTDRWIRNLKPEAGKRLSYSDASIKAENLGGQLVLRASDKSRVFYVRHYVNARPAYYRLGKYPRLGLQEAKEKTRAFLENPEQAEIGTLKDECEKFLKRYVKKKKLRTEKNIKQTLELYVYPRLGKKRFVDVTRSDISRLLDKVEDNHGPRAADHCLQMLRKMMRWQQTRYDGYVCPIVPGMSRYDAKENQRERTLDDEEIRLVWNAAGELGTYGAILKMCLLTAQRLGKVRDIRWEDVDDEGNWTINTQPREKGNGGKLKLPQMALDIIDAQPRIKNNLYIFGAPRSSKAFDNFGTYKKRIDRMLPPDMKAWRTHDLRRTADTLMNDERSGIPPHIPPHVMGHKQKGVAAIYNRHQYVNEKAAALENLSKLITMILNPPTKSENVVELRA